VAYLLSQNEQKYLLIKNVVLLFSFFPAMPLTDFNLTEPQLMFSDLVMFHLSGRELESFVTERQNK